MSECIHKTHNSIQLRQLTQSDILMLVFLYLLRASVSFV